MSSSNQVHWWVRAEVKDGEGRTALIPANVKRLTELGHRVTVERSKLRCFSDAEYEAEGASLAEEGSWEAHAPKDAIVLGLKELCADDSAAGACFPLVHRHVYFAHCYKGQYGGERLLRRFAAGGGRLDDLEFLVDDAGRRVAAFGKAAGLVGAALALLQFASAEGLGEHLRPWASQQAMVADLRAALLRAPRAPVVCVIGALGRVGGGAVETCRLAGVPEENLLLWDLAETRQGGPFDALLGQADILLNCVYLTEKIPPFVDDAALARAGPGRRLSVVSDISCDFTSDNHPLPFFRQGTDIHHPVLLTAHTPPVAVIAIDHLPSLLPRESSVAFSDDLLPTLQSIANQPLPSVWVRSQAKFQHHLDQAIQSSKI